MDQQLSVFKACCCVSFFNLLVTDKSAKVKMFFFTVREVQKITIYIYSKPQNIDPESTLLAREWSSDKLITCCIFNGLESIIIGMKHQMWHRVCVYLIFLLFSLLSARLFSLLVEVFNIYGIAYYTNMNDFLRSRMRISVASCIILKRNVINVIVIIIVR